MAAPIDKSEITLGFVENTESWRLSSKYFPSKVGGKPAWLSMKDLPSSDNLKCGNCGNVCIFLMQVYCPVTELHTCFHRTLFIFCCKDPTCHKFNDNAAFVVLRSQLPRENELYDFEPPDEDKKQSECEVKGGENSTSTTADGLCVVCGCYGGKKCAKCHVKSYCCREHQLIDWKAGHKQNCGVTSGPDSSVNGSLQVLFPEFELVTESEDYCQQDNGVDSSKEECHAVGTEDSGGQGLGVADLEKMALVEGKEDRQFAKFKKRTDHEPDQVIRYQRRGRPLFISCENQPQENAIPPCDRCGSTRQFELQVMPQLLIHLGVDSLQTSIDWGTLIIYTCAESCDEGSAYRQEFLWKQDIAECNK